MFPFIPTRKIIFKWAANERKESARYSSHGPLTQSAEKIVWVGSVGWCMKRGALFVLFQLTDSQFSISFLVFPSAKTSPTVDDVALLGNLFRSRMLNESRN